jgi:hypothetical protein
VAIEVPQLAVPFRIERGRALVVEQDSDAEVMQCVEAVLRYRPGHRLDLPEFGTRDQAHRQGGASMVELADAVERFERRVHATASEQGTDSMGLVQRVAVKVGRAANG